MPSRIKPKNWRDFQHYKDRSPPWIRLHKNLLDNYEFQCLPVASRALAPMLWLLASDSVDGSIDADTKKLAFRLRMTEREVIDALKPLIDNGFFVREQDASSVLAERLRDAVPETETETETEKTLSSASPTGVFDTFWEAYPRKVGKDAARKAFDKRKPDELLLSRMLSAIRQQASSEQWRKDGGQFIPHPATWLNEGRFDDGGVHLPEPVNTQAESTARLIAEQRSHERTAPPPELLARVRSVRSAA